MFAYKVFVLAFLGSGVFAETAKRDLTVQQSGVEFMQLGNFGPISRLANHPSFSHLSLTPQQIAGVVTVLLQNGLLNSGALRLANGQPLWGDSLLGAPNGSFFALPIDPYVLFLSSNYARFLPFGLGPQGIYGSTGLPRPKPFGVFKYNDKNS